MYSLFINPSHQIPKENDSGEKDRLSPVKVCNVTNGSRNDIAIPAFHCPVMFSAKRTKRATLWSVSMRDREHKPIWTKDETSILPGLWVCCFHGSVLSDRKTV